MYGGELRDVLWGSNGDDILYGGAWHDILKGHGHDDKIYGGIGIDTIWGGWGTTRSVEAGVKTGFMANPATTSFMATG